MPNGRWVKLYESLADPDHPVNRKPHYYRVFWDDLLLLADSIGPNRGSYWTTVRRIAERWRISKTQASVMLRWFESEGMIIRTQDTPRSRTQIRVANYLKHQALQKPDHPGPGHKPGHTSGPSPGHNPDTPIQSIEKERLLPAVVTDAVAVDLWGDPVKPKGNWLMTEFMRMMAAADIPITNGKRGKYAATCKRITDTYTQPQVQEALAAMQTMFPWSDGQPIDPFALERHIDKALMKSRIRSSDPDDEIELDPDLWR